MGRSSRAVVVVQREVMHGVYAQILRQNKQTLHDCAWVSEYVLCMTFFCVVIAALFDLFTYACYINVYVV